MRLEPLIPTRKGPIRTADLLRSIAKKVRAMRTTHDKRDELAAQIDALATTIEGQTAEPRG